MDATALRWVLAITGVIVIGGVYLYTQYQNRLRRRAAIKTYTQQELDSGQIEDQELSREISSINNILDQDDLNSDATEIKINPALDTSMLGSRANKPAVHLPQVLDQIEEQYRVAHILKHSDDRVLTGDEIQQAFQHTGFVVADDGFVRLQDTKDAHFKLANMTASGSFGDLNDMQFYSYGMVCFFDCNALKEAKACYELMLKKVDELVRVLDLKVYNDDLQLLTLQHVTDTRKRLEATSNESAR